MEPNDPPELEDSHGRQSWGAVSKAWDDCDNSFTALDDLPDFDCDNRDQWIEHLESLDASLAELQRELDGMRVALEAELERRKAASEEIKE